MIPHRQILSLSSIAYASKFGSGPISSFSSVKKGYAKYIQVLSDGGGYVGVYAVEQEGIKLFDKIDGDFFSIQGLSILPLINFLREHNLILQND